MVRKGISHRRRSGRKCRRAGCEGSWFCRGDAEERVDDIGTHRQSRRAAQNCGRRDSGGRCASILSWQRGGGDGSEKGRRGRVCRSRGPGTALPQGFSGSVSSRVSVIFLHFLWFFIQGDSNGMVQAFEGEYLV